MAFAHGENRPDRAKAAMQAARRASPGASAREQAHINVMTYVGTGAVQEARRAVRAHMQTFPRDALMAQLCTGIFGLIGTSGDVAREADLLAFTTFLMSQLEDDWWTMSMHALALCETGATGASLELMETALAGNPRNGNGAHFKAHALYEMGEITTGRAFLSDWVAGYDARGALHGHMRWHEALWALQDGDLSTVWAAVDAAIAPGSNRGIPLNVLTDTAAILHRAELAGVPVAPERWRDLSAYAARAFPDPGHSFADLHAALAHAMAGNGDALARLTETSSGFAGDLIAPAARGWAAMARQDWAGALEALTPVMASHVRLSGSRAQRDLLELSYANLLLRLGRADEAGRHLATRRPVLARSPQLFAAS